MLNKTILAIALTLTLATAASAATKQDHRWMDAQASVGQTADDVLFERAKGGIEY